MKSFKASFQIVEENNCPLYVVDDLFILTEKSVYFPGGKESCLILIRELTQLLFELIGTADEPDLLKQYTCSGCTGLIKFKQIQDQRDGVSIVHNALLSEKEQRLLDRITRYPLLQSIPTNKLSEFIPCFRGKIIKKGDFLIRKGELNRYLYLLLSGEVQVEDGDVPLTRLGEGEVCGEMSYFGDSIAGASVKGLTETRVLAIRGDDFGRLISSSSDVQRYMAELLAKRLSQANAIRTSDFEFSMLGHLDEMAPAELFQVFHMHQKTGVLRMGLPGGDAKVVFCDGAIVEGSYSGRDGQDAVFKILQEREGVYNFVAGVSDEEREKPPIGDFMMLLMEGVKRDDER